jgi:hypothetical protein
MCTSGDSARTPAIIARTSAYGRAGCSPPTMWISVAPCSMLSRVLANTSSTVSE